MHDQRARLILIVSRYNGGAGQLALCRVCGEGSILVQDGQNFTRLRFSSALFNIKAAYQEKNRTC